MGSDGNKFTDEQLMELINKGFSGRAIARELNVNESSIRSRRRKLALKGFAPEYDMTKLVPEGFHVKGVSTHYNSEGKPTNQWVKSSLDKQQEIQAIKELIEDLVESLPKNKTFILTPKAKEYCNTDLLAVYPLGDPHIGMLAWEEECGESWDLKIAEETYDKLFSRVVQSAPSCSTCLIANVGDLLHYDNIDGFTSKSKNILDRDGRYAKMVRVVFNIIIKMIDLCLLYHDKVHVVNARGNHDNVGSIFLSVALKHIYEKNDRVVIDQSPGSFHYLEFGMNLLGIHHGDTCKMQDLPGVMASDKPEAWGRTKHRTWLTGHIHNSSRLDYMGCIVESFRTLAPKDAYASAGGWRAGRDTQAIVYHKDYGEIERHRIDISQMKRE